MMSIQTIKRTFSLLVSTATCFAATVGTAWAAAVEPPAKPATTSWGISYALVFLGIVLGLLVVLRPTMRRDRAHPEKYGE